MHLSCCASTMVPCFNTMNSFTTLRLGVGALSLLVSALKKPFFNTWFGMFMFNTTLLFVVPLQSPLISQCSAHVTVQPSPEYQAAAVKQKNTNTAELRGGLPSFFNLLLCHFSQRFT